MNIKKVCESMDEKGLDGAGLFALNNLCNSASSDRVKYLISLFNNGSNELKPHEICFLINYVIKGRVKSVAGEGYDLYQDDSGKKIILSAQEVASGNYIILDTQNSEENSVAKIKEDLEGVGFKFLETKEFLLAFCEERNIVFYSPSIDYAVTYYGGDSICFFQQPNVGNNGEKKVSFYLKLENCKKGKLDFPLFSEERCGYLSLYDRAKDEDSPFVSSMKRIAQYPVLYDAVGPQNKALIDNILSSELQKIDEQPSRHLTKR